VHQPGGPGYVQDELTRLPSLRAQVASDADRYRLSLLPRTVPVLRRCFRTNHYERAGGRTSWAGDGSFIDKSHRTSARTAICDDQHLVLVTLPSARCRLAVGTRNSHRAFTTSCGRSGRLSRRTFCAVRAWRAWWPRRSRRTGVALFTRRPGRAGLPLWALPAACYANGKRDRNSNAFHVHAHTFTFRRPGVGCWFLDARQDKSVVSATIPRHVKRRVVSMGLSP
jgi:hypothetical protein